MTGLRAAAARALQRVSRVAARRPKTKVEGPCAPPGQSEGVKIYAHGGGPLAPGPSVWAASLDGSTRTDLGMLLGRAAPRVDEPA